MINPQDISINKFFLQDGKEICIRDHNIAFFLQKPDELEGIPLTENHLEMAGISETNNTWFINGLRLYRSVHNRKWVVRYKDVFIKNISYLHEFQGLIWELIQLTLKEEKP